MRLFKRFDLEIYKRRPDQMILRFNQIVDQLNDNNFYSEVIEKDGKRVLVSGMQPDKTFGLKYWDREGDQYVYVGEAGGGGGSAGATGPTGPAGPSGATGAGFTGATGPLGPTGPLGGAGPEGATGSTGVQGIQGIQGATGVTGLQGFTGATGQTGPQGNIGFTGPAGGIGATGPQGIIGDIGFTGAQGIAGPIGATGATGDIGPTGVTGFTGPAGPTGVTGVQGFTGAQGVAGPAGATGPTGIQGFTGPAGTNGTNGTNGFTGATGVQGIQGVQGFTGAAGASGVAGVNGATGATGPAGTNGAVGATGAGATGATGPITAAPVINQTPGGLVNSSNVNFTTAAAFATGSLEVYLNGQKLRSGAGNDYVEVTSGFTMQYAPVTGDVLVVNYLTTSTGVYIQGSNSLIVGEVPAGTVNGTNAVFTTQFPYIASSLEPMINGLAQARTTHFTETTPTTGVFTFDVAPKTGDIITVNYQRLVSSAGNADTVDGYHADDLAPIGTLLLDAGLMAPSGNWLQCFGQAISRATYAALFTRLGTTYGAGDGSTTFNIPDLRGRVPAGQDDMGGISANRLTNPTGSTIGGIDGDTLGGTGGAETHVITKAQLATISGTATIHGAGAATVLAGVTGDIGVGPSRSNYRSGGADIGGAGSYDSFSLNVGSNTPHNNVQPTIILNYIIKVL